MHDSRSNPAIALLTDFGIEDNYVGVMKGVIQSIAPGTDLIDLSHHIPPQDIRAACFLLEKSITYFPLGTVFLCVVDPGVGTKRRKLVVSQKGRFFIGPDNGLLSPCLSEEAEVVELENPQYRLPEVSNTFHGRDLFAPAAAHLARGVPIQDFGPRCADPIILEPSVLESRDEGWTGEIVYVDRFGNLVSCFETERFFPLLKQKEYQVVTQGGVLWPYVTAYGDVPPGVKCSVFGGFGSLELSVNLGNAALVSGLKTGDQVCLEKC